MVQEQQKLQQNKGQHKRKGEPKINVITSCHNSQMHL